MRFEPVPKRQRIYEVVAERIEAMIRSGGLADGDELPSERELRDMFDVGRPAVREALLMLQQRGLIAMSNGERARVTRPDPRRLITSLSGSAKVYLREDDGVRQFQACRRVFEAGVVREVARTATAADIERIQTALAANCQAVGNRELFSQTDVAFHLEIVRSLSNPVLIGVHEALSGWLTEQRRTSLMVRGADASAVEFHTRIFEAIRSHDPDGAEAAMLSHLDAVFTYYWSDAGSSE